MIAKWFGAPEVSRSDLTAAYRPIITGYLAAGAAYFFLFSLLHVVVVGGASGIGLGAMSAVTGVYCLAGRQVLRRETFGQNSVELVVLGHNLLAAANLVGRLAVGYDFSQLAFFPIAILGFALLSPTWRTSLFTIVVALAMAAAVTPPRDLASYGYVIGVAIFGALLASTLLQMALRREIHTRRQLSESESKYRLLAENIGDVIFRTDLDGIIEYASPSIQNLTGLVPDVWIGRNVNDRIVVDADIKTLEYVRKNLPLPTGRANEFQYRRADGSMGWAQGNPTVIRDSDGAPIGLMSVIRDVTERRTIEDELRRKTAEAEAAVVAKSEFLANMSHEIRTPLTAVIGFGELLAQMSELPERPRLYAERIARSGQALLGIVNDVLDFSKIEAGEVELKPEPINPEDLVGETLDRLRDKAAEKGLTLALKVDGRLPDLVLADRGRIGQVLTNLVANALKFTSQGGVTVDLSYETKTQRLQLSVSDTGIGIPKARADRLFERFSQIDATYTRRFGGVGLGLAISRTLVEAMDGTIGFESEEGVGSTFRFTVHAPVTRPGPDVPGAAAETPEIAPLRILVVDDVVVNRELIAAMLEPFDLNLSQAGDGQEAVEAADRQPFDLILMDLQMPRMNGLTATQTIRTRSKLNGATPILALSANVLPQHVEECLQAGMNDHVGKPINPEELLTKIEQWAQTNEQRLPVVDGANP